MPWYKVGIKITLLMVAKDEKEARGKLFGRDIVWIAGEMDMGEFFGMHAVETVTQVKDVVEEEKALGGDGTFFED